MGFGGSPRPVGETVFAVYVNDTADQVKIDRAVEKHRRRDSEPTLTVCHHAAEITGFANDGGVSGAVEPVIHLFHQAGNAAAEDLDCYWIWA